MIRPHRNHPGYWAFLVHRLSGLALILFLPLHFLALGTALKGEAGLQDFLDWTENPLCIQFAWVFLIHRGRNLTFPGRHSSAHIRLRKRSSRTLLLCPLTSRV